jgi:endo-1,4-beta-D-glucanase Y/4-amino-4-deoxy-L-arabinose transferase-like glycosyltransferase
MTNSNRRNEKTLRLPVITPEMLEQHRNSAPVAELPASYRNPVELPAPRPEELTTVHHRPGVYNAPEYQAEAEIISSQPLTAPRAVVVYREEATTQRPALKWHERTAPFRAIKALAQPSVAAPDLADNPENLQPTVQMAVPVMAGRGLEWETPAVKTPRAASLARVHTWAREELLLMLGLVCVGLVMHGLNMFNYPALNRFDDEGIYMSQAWSVLRLGQLAPYTYFYDHAPGGWLLLAGWLGISGGPLTFGSAVDSGRMFMLLLHLAMIPLLYQIARKFGCGMGAAALATLLFSISPLAILYQRLVMLDNIMMFWLLLSLNFLLDGRGRLSRVIFSGLCFGMAILSKETAVFVLPAMFFIAWQQRWKHQGRFGLLGWILPMGAVLSLYPLYALLKGELLPAGYSLAFFILNMDTPPDKVSLIDALRWQATRGGDGAFWKLATDTWLKLDPVLFAGGALAIVINLLRIVRKDRRAFAVGLLGLLPLYYLARGGLVFDYYIIFAIPFLALNLAMALNPLLRLLPRQLKPALVLVATGVLLGVYIGMQTLQPLFTQRPDVASREATAWIKQNLPSQSLIVIRNDMWVDLHEPGLGGPSFPNAHSHWKVALDPSVRDGVFHNDWHMVDYVVVSPQFKQDLIDTNATLVLDALKNATLVKRWESAGNQLEVWKVNNGKPVASSDETVKMLDNSASYLSGHFEQDGAYFDAKGIVSGESQSNALLRAVWTDNRAEFNRVWQWTQEHLLDQNNLLAGQWQQNRFVERQTNSSADTNTALALLMAGKRWNDPKLQAAGQSIVKAIWEHEVVTVGDSTYLAAGDWATQGTVISVNPSYFAPYAYRVFQEVDPDHNWRGLIDSGYKLLFDASSNPLGASRSAGLPPNWIGVERATGQLVPVNSGNEDLTRYGYDAATTYWRIALDSKWSGDGRAKTFLQQAGFLRDEVARKGSVSALYAHDGTLLNQNTSVVSTVGALSALLTLDPASAYRLYDGQVLGQIQANGQGAYWDNPADLYAQEWGWFGTALYADQLPDLWHKANQG